MNKKPSLFIYLILLSFGVWGQGANPPDLDQRLGLMTIPSANVSSLLRFDEVPVNLYTGTPDISVPIYTINTGKLSLPITLRYSASGIRVTENASSVGLGWTLNAEGILQETVLSIPDNNTYHQNGLGWDNSMLDPQVASEFSILDGIANGGQDGAPDLYTFSFNGYSGKFIYADVIRTLPQQNLAINTYMGSGGEPEWKIVTQDGTQYIFINIEKTMNKSSQTVTRSRTWYLNKIIDANNTDSITFQYEPTIVDELAGRSYSFTTWRPNSTYPLPFSNDMQPGDPPIPGTLNSVQQISHGWQLKKIIWNNGSIEYDLAWGDREDMTVGSPRVKNLFLKNTDDEIIRVIHFVHDYFVTPGSTDMMGKRLRLHSVTFAPDLASIFSPIAHKYSFEYNPLPLPEKNSNQIDHWGFYNGATINNSRGLIPSFTYPGMHYYGADRDANPYYTKAAMLTKMNYPTGGYAAFTWGSHVKSYPTQLLDSTIEYRDSVIYMELACDSTEEYLVETEDHIAIPTSPNDLFGLGLQANFHVDMYTGGQNYSLTVNHAAGAGWLLERPVGAPLTTTPTVKASKNFSFQQNGEYNYDKDVTLTPGKYYGIKGHINHPGFGVRIALTVKWPRKVPNTYTPPSDYLGGCLISKIVLFDTFTRKAVIKNYQYSTPKFMGVPDYYKPMFKYWLTTANPPGGAGQCNYHQEVEGLYVSSNSIHNFNAGVQAGYDWVKEIIGNNGEGGSTLYRFSNFSELNRVGEIPASWRYGRLNEKIVYNGMGGELHRTTYYNKTIQNPSEHFAGRSSERMSTHPCFLPGSSYSVYFDQKVYDFPCDWIYTDTVTTYDALSGIHGLSVTNYNNAQHRQPTSATTFLSDGSRQTTFYKYPTDLTLGSTPSGDAEAVARLQQKHMHSIPLESYTQKWPSGSSSPLTIAATYSQFKNLPNNNVVLQTAQDIELTQGISNFQPLAAAGNVLSKDSRYAIQGTVEEYDRRNNVMTVQTEGNRKAGYIWGYNNTFPIAKVANDSFSHKRAFTSFEKNAPGKWQYDENYVVTTDKITGKRAYNLTGAPNVVIEIPASPGAPMIPHQPVPGEFIVSYWSKGGSVYVNAGNGGPAASMQGTIANGWTYYEHVLADPLNSIQITGTGLVDELRFYLKGAQMESFTYDPLFGITSTDDAGSHITLYEYDAMGRLSLEKDVFGNILKKHTYQYFGEQQ